MEKLAMIISEIIGALEILNEGGNYVLDVCCDFHGKWSCHCFFDKSIGVVLFETRSLRDFVEYDKTILGRWKQLSEQVRGLMKANGSRENNFRIEEASKVGAEVGT
jgi:hypothetical protein